MTSVPFLPDTLKSNLNVLSHEGAALAISLAENGQSHLFQHWEPPGRNDDAKRAMMDQLHTMENSMVGGILGYLSRARKLLQESSANPFVGWRPEIPHGVHLEPYTSEYSRYEQLGCVQLGCCGFVLVAGGLGERLGYHGIKIALPVQTLTRTCYLEHYCQQLLAMQSRYAAPGVLLPLAIMVSDDTHAQTLALLQSSGYFGMREEQITLMKQGEVPALISNDAAIAMRGPYAVEAKPHGHGDVHSLMHSTGTAQKWLDSGVRHIVFFQDTNGLALYTLPAMLGVSQQLGLQVNSLTVPRVANQAIGAIAKLIHEDGREMTVNVEYNQLDPLLRSVSAEGDANDPLTGHSPFPGNINQLLFALPPYVDVLEQTKGLMPEFVNPKYQDASRTVFKKPTRLECMMQDYPKLLPAGAKVGFSSAPAWLCFSPCKNNSADAAAAVATGVPAASPYTAEADQYQVFAQLLRCLGAQVEEGPEVTILGVVAKPAPRIVIHPSCALFPHELAQRFPLPGQLSITSRSSLMLQGDVIVEMLRLDGSLQVAAAEGSQVVLRIADEVRNVGHSLHILEGEELEAAPEVDRMRGYRLQCQEMKTADLRSSQIVEHL